MQRDVQSSGQHTHMYTQRRAFSMIQGTLSFGSLAERIDFNLSGVDFQEQIIEPLNLICCLRDPQRTVITWWFGSEQPAPPRPLSLPHRLHKTWHITFNITLSEFVLHNCAKQTQTLCCRENVFYFHSELLFKRCDSWQMDDKIYKHTVTLLQCTRKYILFGSSFQTYTFSVTVFSYKSDIYKSSGWTKDDKNSRASSIWDFGGWRLYQ